MNHNCTHCIDFGEYCPPFCELAKLGRDLKNMPDRYVTISYAHFFKSCMCPCSVVTGNAMKATITDLMKGDTE